MPMSRLRRSSALALAGLTVTTLGMGALQADLATAASSDAKVSSSIKLTPNMTKLKGKVTSPKSSCKKQKDVVLHWQNPGQSSYQVVANDQSSKSGEWSISAPSQTIPAGRYYVTVAKSKGCKAAKSKVVKVN